MSVQVQSHQIRARRELKERTCSDCAKVFKRARNGSRCNTCDHAYNKTHGPIKVCEECQVNYRGHSAKLCLTCRKQKWRTGAGASKPSSSPRARRNQMLKRTYGVTIEQMEALYHSQEGKCAICKTPKNFECNRLRDGLVVDHDHVTGKVRGLLCMTCNSGMGQLRDSVDLLKSAIGYLERNAE